MFTVRAHLTWLAATTLALQLGVMVAAATAVCCGGSPPGAATSEMQCCKDGGPAHICPLKAKQNRDPGAPVLENCCDVDQHALAALLGFAGILEARSTAVPWPEIALLAPPASEQLLLLVSPPLAPPPRS